MKTCTHARTHAQIETRTHACKHLVESARARWHAERVEIYDHVIFHFRLFTPPLPPLPSPCQSPLLLLSSLFPGQWYNFGWSYGRLCSLLGHEFVPYSRLPLGGPNRGGLNALQREDWRVLSFCLLEKNCWCGCKDRCTWEDLSLKYRRWTKSIKYEALGLSIRFYFCWISFRKKSWVELVFVLQTFES